jgi:hypothetical protein
MMVSEGTIYPLKTKDQQDREDQSIAKRRNAMPITYRFVILSFGDKENNIVNAPKIHPYLTTGRQVMIEINHAPIVSWFKANDETIKCEVRLGIIYNDNDTIKLLGKKEALRNQLLPEEPTPVQTIFAVPTSNVAAQLANLQTQLNALINDQSTNTAAEPMGSEPEDTVVETVEAGEINPF